MSRCSEKKKRTHSCSPQSGGGINTYQCWKLEDQVQRMRTTRPSRPDLLSAGSTATRKGGPSWHLHQKVSNHLGSIGYVGSIGDIDLPNPVRGACGPNILPHYDSRRVDSHRALCSLGEELLISKT